MKLLIFLSLALTCLISCQTATAQPLPAISKKYSDGEIEKMIDNYKSIRQRDIRPTTNQQQQFLKDFPNARDIEWEVGANVYEVEFEVGHTDYKAYYDESANLIMYALEIREVDFPAIVKNAAMSKYPNYKFDDIEKVVRGSETFYKVEMEKGKSEVKAIFKPDGTFVKEIYN
ncbi:MAG: hypothetical protein ACK5M3_00105 [Dysgonomonas sp.]